MADSKLAAKTAAMHRGGDANHAELHGEHRQWRSESALWRDDIAIWQEELKKALADLAKVEAALREHEAALQVHASAIRCYEQDLASHERALAEYERGGPGNDLTALAGAHQKEGEKHAQQRGAHERIKKHHHTMVAQWNLVLKTLGAAV